MPGYHTIRTSARRLADKSDNADVKALADLVIKLADECEKSETKSQPANRSHQARRK